MKTHSGDPILGVGWLSTVLGTIGIVAAKTDKNEWQAYMGVVKDTWSQEYAAQRVADQGSRLTAEQAHAFFPRLDIKKYKQQI